MPRNDSAGDDHGDLDGDREDFGSGDGTDAWDDDGLHDSDSGRDEPGDGPSGGFDAGTGLTEPERELADELNRRRELAATRSRFERAAGNGPLGDGGGGFAVDHDALAVIDAARRFGVDEAEDAAAYAEREAITAALAASAERPPKQLDQYDFYAIIDKQATTKMGNISLTLLVPWEFHEEVFRALETMPFRAMVRMTEVEPGTLDE